MRLIPRGLALFISVFLVSLGAGCQKSEPTDHHNPFYGQWFGAFSQDQQFSKQIALTFGQDGLFTLRNVSDLLVVKGQFYFNDAYKKAYFYIENNPTHALNLQERTTMIASYSFPESHQLIFETPHRRYTLNQSSYKLDQKYGIDGHWLCFYNDDEIWRLYVDANSFYLSQNLKSGLTYFHEGTVFYGDGSEPTPTKMLHNISFFDMASHPSRSGFSLSSGAVIVSADQTYTLILKGEVDSKIQVSCYRANDLVY